MTQLTETAIYKNKFLVNSISYFARFLIFKRDFQNIIYVRLNIFNIKSSLFISF
jgi:hypothetical protein